MPRPLASRRAQGCSTFHTLICSGEHRIPLQTDFGSSSFTTLLSFPLFLNDFSESTSLYITCIRTLVQALLLMNLT